MDAHDVAHVLVATRRKKPVWTAFVSQTLDLTLSATLLVVLAPLFACIAIAIRIDTPGGVLFRQRRIGRDGERFTLLKFRTMLDEADPARHRAYVRQLILHDSQTQTHDTRGLYKLAVDDRITAVGRFLRRWSLDELPQLWNVLRGEMSIVGPRPVIPYELELYPRWYFGRFAVKPGLTGLWQVSGRSHRTYEEMVKYDIDYVRRQSLGLDFIILAKTLWTVITGKGAA